MDDHSKPHLHQISRRQFVKWASAGAAVAAAGTAGTLTLLKGRSSSPPDGSAIPVQNPAFRSTPGDGEGHFVLFCQVGTNEPKDFLAFDLNATAWAIWSLCAPHGSACSDSARSMGQIAETLAGQLEPKEVVQFVSVMCERGLVYFADSETQIFWEYQSVR